MVDATLTGERADWAQREVSRTFEFEAGALVRKEARYHLERAAMIHGVKLRIIENKGWFSSQFFGRVSGPRDKVASYNRAILHWSIRMSEDR